MGTVRVAAEETIAAVATPPGEGALAVIRMSGRDALAILERVFEPGRGGRRTRWPGYRARWGIVRHPVTGEPADEVVALVMRAPHSYTGEDQVELSCHGGAASVGAVLGALRAAGARLAEPGEFTRRAFLNGRIDLAQAEAVIGLIRAKGEAGRRAALRQLRGTLSARVRELTEEALRLLAHAEAAIDFPEDEVDDFPEESFRRRLERLEAETTALAATFRTGRLLREGAQVGIVGRPNVGKSSLFNALLARDRAIVSDRPGTTRDVLSEEIELGGRRAIVVDTAGLHATDDPVERLGVERTERTIEEADLLLAVLDGSVGMTAADRELLARLPAQRTIVVVNKADLGTLRVGRADLSEAFAERPFVRLSARTGEGLERLRARIVEALGGAAEESVVVTTERQQEALLRAAAAFREAGAALAAGLTHDVAAIDLRAGWRALASITGEGTDEDVIDRVFRDFCLGK